VHRKDLGPLERSDLDLGDDESVLLRLLAEVLRDRSRSPNRLTISLRRSAKSLSSMRLGRCCRTSCENSSMTWASSAARPAGSVTSVGASGSAKLWTKARSIGTPHFGERVSRIRFTVVVRPVPVSPDTNALYPGA
jgi:hypothetical protein